MIITYTFEIEDLADFYTDEVEFLDPSVGNYLVALINNLIDQSECERDYDYSQLQLLIAEADGMQEAFAFLATTAMRRQVEEIQPAIIQSLKEQGILL